MSFLKKYENCLDSSPYHEMKEIDKVTEMSWGYQIERKLFECSFCRKRWVLVFDSWGEPTEKKLYALLFAKDFMQPSHPDFEKVYGKGQAEFIRSEHKKNSDAESQRSEMKEDIQDFKGHYSKGRKLYGR